MFQKHFEIAYLDAVLELVTDIHTQQNLMVPASFRHAWMLLWDSILT
jgi:hypothetical protein